MRKLTYFAAMCLLFSMQACAGEMNSNSQNNGTVINPNDYEDLVEKGTAAIEQGNFIEAYNLAYPYAAAGNAEAQFAVGLIVSWGHSPDKLSDQEKNDLAISWFKRAALSGHTEAMQLLSDTYINGWYGQTKSMDMSNCWTAALSGKVQPKSCK